VSAVNPPWGNDILALKVYLSTKRSDGGPPVGLATHSLVIEAVPVTGAGALVRGFKVK